MELTLTLRADLAVYCPRCGGLCILRRPRWGDGWEAFWGCEEYPHCNGSVKIGRNGEPIIEEEGSALVRAIWREDRMTQRRQAPATPPASDGPTEAQLVAMIVDYAELERQVMLLESDREIRRKELLGPQAIAVLARVDAELEAEYGERVKWGQSGLASRLDRIKGAVIAFGQSVKAEGLQMVLSKGRPKVNVEALEGYAAAHPEVKAFIQHGEPSVSVRRDKTWTPPAMAQGPQEAAEGEF